MSMVGWLSGLGLAAYEKQLVDDGFDTLDALVNLTEEDMLHVGISKTGHRKLLLRAVASLQQPQLQVQQDHQQMALQHQLQQQLLLSSESPRRSSGPAPMLSSSTSSSRAASFGELLLFVNPDGLDGGSKNGSSSNLFSQLSSPMPSVVESTAPAAAEETALGSRAPQAQARPPPSQPPAAKRLKFFVPQSPASLTAMMLPGPAAFVFASSPSSSSSTSSAPSTASDGATRSLAADLKNNGISVTQLPLDLSGDGPAAASIEGKRRYRKRPKKDENAPERPNSAYVMFARRVRDDLKVTSPDMSFAEISRIVGARWKALAPGDRNVFIDLASHAHASYLEQLEQYRRVHNR